MEGAGGASFAQGLRNAGLVVIELATGAADMPAIVAQLIANLAIIRQCSHLVVWDGSANGLTTVAAYSDQLEAGLDAVGLPFIVVPAGVPYNLGPGTTALAIRDEWETRWPGRVYDWRDDIPNTDGVINQDRMLDYPSDLYHLNQTAYDEAGAGVAAML